MVGWVKKDLEDRKHEMNSIHYLVWSPSDSRPFFVTSFSIYFYKRKSPWRLLSFTLLSGGDHGNMIIDYKSYIHIYNIISTQKISVVLFSSFRWALIKHLVCHWPPHPQKATKTSRRSWTIASGWSQDVRVLCGLGLLGEKIWSFQMMWVPLLKRSARISGVCTGSI